MAHESPLPSLPNEPIGRLTAPIQRFMHVEAAGGVVLLLATVTALILANSPWAEGFLSFWKTRVGFTLGSFSMDHSLKHWINDGLMAVFFFVIGLEVKREIAIGELRDMKRASLPIAAAIGGSPESLSRLIQRLHEEEIIDWQGKDVRILGNPLKWLG